MPKISVIIPVHNAEKHIKRCINSILAQSFKDFELLIINDGSTDNSGNICDEYANKDNRIHVFHKGNGGVSSARQWGMENACGDYIIHVDSDDWIKDDMLECLYDKAIQDNSDMVICDFYYVDKHSRISYIRQTPSTMDCHVIIDELLNGSLHGSTWNKLVRLSIFKNHKISFPKDVNYLEDLWVNLSLLSNNINVSYLDKAFYYYDRIINSDSITRKISKNSVESVIRFCEHWKNIYADKMYHSKTLAKQAMFRSSAYDGKDITSLYSEINSEYIQRNSRLSYKNELQYCVALTIKGHYKIAVLIDRIFMLLIIPIGKQIKQLIKTHIKSI